jgi:hypothetical protein
MDEACFCIGFQDSSIVGSINLLAAARSRTDAKGPATLSGEPRGLTWQERFVRNKN